MLGLGVKTGMCDYQTGEVFVDDRWQRREVEFWEQGEDEGSELVQHGVARWSQIRSQAVIIRLIFLSSMRRSSAMHKGSDTCTAEGVVSPYTEMDIKSGGQQR